MGRRVMEMKMQDKREDRMREGLRERQLEEEQSLCFDIFKLNVIKCSVIELKRNRLKHLTCHITVLFSGERASGESRYDMV